MADLSDIEEAKRWLSYDPETGLFHWIASRRHGWVGKVAGNVDPDNGYVRIRVAGKLRYAHRLAWAFVHGKWPDNLIDHKNCDRTGNRLSNLRAATYSENLCNSKIRTVNKSGFKGVAFYARDGVWVAEISFNRKRIYLGRYATRRAAANAYWRAAQKHHAEFARAC